jgi:hypothetical protein
MPKTLRKALHIVDPNTLLSGTRAALLTVLDLTDTNTPGTEALVSAASELAGTFHVLDGWLSRDGSAPSAWRTMRDAPAPTPRQANSSPVSIADFPDDQRVVSSDGSAATFVDRWDCDITDDYQSDFADAIASARWLDPREGRVGTLANKENVVLVTHQRMTTDDAFQLARELIVAGDRRIADPSGPAGAIPLDVSDGCARQPSPAWCFFGWARILELPIIL